MLLSVGGVCHILCFVTKLLVRYLSDNIKEEFYHHHKQIWIITKGISRQIKVINTVEVKEIGIADIIFFYKDRLTGNMSHQTIEMRLQNL